MAQQITTEELLAVVRVNFNKQLLESQVEIARLRHELASRDFLDADTKMREHLSALGRHYNIDGEFTISPNGEIAEKVAQ